MREAAFTEFRNQAKQFFDLVEAGETVRVLRNGKPIAEIQPIQTDLPSWKLRKARPPSNGWCGDQQTDLRRARQLMRVYFDSSAFAKRYVSEPGTAESPSMV